MFAYAPTFACGHVRSCGATTTVGIPVTFAARHTHAHAHVRCIAQKNNITTTNDDDDNTTQCKCTHVRVIK